MSDHVSDDDLFDELAADDDGATPPMVRVPQPGVRERIRSSRFGTLIVLVIVAAVVAAGVWLVNRGTAQDQAAQTGGSTVIKLPGTSGVPPPEVGKPAADFTLTGTDGTPVSLASLRGKPVWLTFGATWCSGCQAEVPDIQEVWVKYRGSGLVVLGVNIQEDNPAVKAFADRVGLTFPMAADPNATVADSYAVAAIPSHYFIDAGGVIRDIRVGALGPSTMDDIVSKLVGNA